MLKLTRTKLTLEKRTDTLRTLVRQNAAAHKLEKAAAKVRVARIQVLRAQIGELSPALFTKRYNRQIAKLNRRLDSLLATTPLEILAEFQLFDGTRTL